MNSKENNERFLAYLTGKLSREASDKLGNELIQNQKLREELKYFQLRHEQAALEMIQEERRTKAIAINKSRQAKMEEIKHLSKPEQLAHLVRDAQERAKTSRTVQSRPNLRKIYRYTAMAASVLLLVFAGNFILNQSNNGSSLSTPELALSYYSQTVPDVGRGGAEDAWMAAQGLYIEGSYDEAIDVMETITVRTPEVNYLLAHAYFIIQDYQRSADIFKIVAQSNNAFSNDAKWNSVLATLAQPDKLAEGERELNNFILNSPSHSRAAELSVKLREK